MSPPYWLNRAPRAWESSRRGLALKPRTAQHRLPASAVRAGKKLRQHAIRHGRGNLPACRDRVGTRLSPQRADSPMIASIDLVDPRLVDRLRDGVASAPRRCASAPARDRRTAAGTRRSRSDCGGSPSALRDRPSSVRSVVSMSRHPPLSVVGKACSWSHAWNRHLPAASTWLYVAYQLLCDQSASSPA